MSKDAVREETQMEKGGKRMKGAATGKRHGGEQRKDGEHSACHRLLTSLEYIAPAQTRLFLLTALMESSVVDWAQGTNQLTLSFNSELEGHTQAQT